MLKVDGDTGGMYDGSDRSAGFIYKRDMCDLKLCAALDRPWYTLRLGTLTSYVRVQKYGRIVTFPWERGQEVNTVPAFGE
jgi:hypothetical protein